LNQDPHNTSTINLELETPIIVDKTFLYFENDNIQFNLRLTETA